MKKEELFEIITGHAREVVPALENYQFQFNDALRDLGANSMDRSEIIMMTLESLNMEIPLIELAGVQNIGELTEVLYEKKSQTS